jgi:hypothetical protein
MADSGGQDFFLLVFDKKRSHHKVNPLFLADMILDKGGDIGGSPVRFLPVNHMSGTRIHDEPRVLDPCRQLLLVA